MNRKQELEKLKKEMEEDTALPLRANATQLVFGEGNPEAQVYFLGEAPGFWEDRQGRPFVGQAGKLLDQLINGVGMNREDVYISNIVRFRPPENRDPLPSEIKAFEPYVDREIEIINPRIIVTLGRWSMAKFLPDALISRAHGTLREINWQGKTVSIIPMYHPAAALRSSEILDKIREDFKMIPKILEEKRSGKIEQMSLV